jgi:hypothetical protein
MALRASSSWGGDAKRECFCCSVWPICATPPPRCGLSGGAEGGILLETEAIQLIYKALRYYNPTGKEAHLHGILVEEFEELLATEYIELQLGEE